MLIHWAGTGLAMGTSSLGEIYTIDKSVPSVPIVTSSLRADPNPTSARCHRFIVTFSEAVSGVDPADFTLTTTGSVSGAS